MTSFLCSVRHFRGVQQGGLPHRQIVNYFLTGKNHAKLSRNKQFKGYSKPQVCAVEDEVLNTTILSTPSKVQLLIENVYRRSLTRDTLTEPFRSISSAFYNAVISCRILLRFIKENQIKGEFWKQRFFQHSLQLL